MGFAVPVESGWGDSKKVAWCECSLWGKKSEGRLIDYMKKGQEIVVIGEIGLETYQANDGNERTKMTLNVSDIALVGGSGASNGNQATQNGGQPSSRGRANGQQGGFPTQGGGQQDPFANAAPMNQAQDDGEIPF